MLGLKLLQLSKDSYPDFDSKIIRLFQPLNYFFQQVYQLSTDIVLGQNIPGMWYTIRFATLATYNTGDFPRIIFQPSFKKTVKSVLISQFRNVGNLVVNTNPVTCQYEVTVNGIEIIYVTGLNNSTTYDITFRVEGG